MSLIRKRILPRKFGISNLMPYLCTQKTKDKRFMEAKTTNVTTRRRLSKTIRTARANKWMIELVDPELQAQCKSYKDGKKIINP